MSEIVLDKSFYNAEERCGYYVSEKNGVFISAGATFNNLL
jgi:hypothetical protein